MNVCIYVCLSLDTSNTRVVVWGEREREREREREVGLVLVFDSKPVFFDAFFFTHKSIIMFSTNDKYFY